MTIQQEIYYIMCIINYYKLIGIDLSSILQINNFTGKIEDDDDATMFFYFWKAAKNKNEFLFRFVNFHIII